MFGRSAACGYGAGDRRRTQEYRGECHDQTGRMGGMAGGCLRGRNFQSTVVGVDASNLSARAMLERFVSDADGNFINFNDKEYDATFKKQSRR